MCSLCPIIRITVVRAYWINDLQVQENKKGQAGRNMFYLLKKLSIHLCSKPGTEMQNYRTKARVPTTKHGYLPQSFLYLGLVSLSIWFGQFLTLKFSFHTDMSDFLYHAMLHWRSEFLECMCVIYRNMMHSSHVRHFTDTGMRGNGIVLYLEKLSSCADRFI